MVILHVKIFNNTLLRRENNHPLKLAYKIRFEVNKVDRPCLTWKDSLNVDLYCCKNIEIEVWKHLA